MNTPQAPFDRHRAAIHVPDEGELPAFDGATRWLNSAPLTAADLRGRVVLVDFWTCTCINWLRTLPYVRAWAERYERHGLVVIGVHTPEFDVEHDVGTVRRAVEELGVGYPVAMDNDYAVWTAFHNRYWPVVYLADAEGRIRYHHARDVNVVMGPSERDTPVRFQLCLDGQPPAPAHGIDVDEHGEGTVVEPRLYQLVRQAGPVSERTLEITFLDPGLRAYAFTFG